VVSLIVGTTRLSKVLMDGGSGLIILYICTLDRMGIPQSRLCPNKAPFYGIVPRKEAMPLRRIWLDVTFGQPDNFCKELLTFEVVNLHNVYHTILGCPCFAKFIAIPNYTYYKLKVPGPMGVITINGSFKVAHYCEQDCVAQAATLVAPCDPVNSGRNAGKDLAEESTKAALLA
jgi:hypothetical protein